MAARRIEGSFKASLFLSGISTTAAQPPAFVRGHYWASSPPRHCLQVDNTISGDDSKLNVELRFNHIEDFDPVNLVKQVVPLRRLFEARQRLRDLLTKLDGNDDLDQLLQDVVANTEGLQEIKAARPEAEAAPAGDSEPPADQPA